MNKLDFLVAELQNAPPVDVDDSLNLIVGRRLQREQEAENARKHCEIVPICRAQVEKVSHMRDMELPAAVARVEASWQPLEHALQRLWAHQAHRPAPDRYPSSDELAAYDELTGVLESEAAEARDEKLSAEQARDKLTADFLGASEELAKLQRQESALRPKVEEPHHAGFSLSGVR